MGRKYNPSDEIIRAAAVAAIPKMKLVADKIGQDADAKRIRYDDEGRVQRQTGERTKYSRPYERVVFTNAAQEHGTTTKRRRRILGGAVEGNTK